MTKNLQQSLTKLDNGVLKVDKLNFNKPLELNIHLNDQAWVDKILFDLISENNPSDNNPNHKEKAELSLDIHIEKKHSTRFDDYVLVSGKVDISYPAECVRCLDLTSQSITCEFNSCFLKNFLENSPEYKDSLKSISIQGSRPPFLQRK